MNIAIIGKSKFNKILANELKANGISPCVIEDTEQIEKIDGETGEFIITTYDGSIFTKGIIITQEPNFMEVTAEEYPFINLSNVEDVNNIGDYKTPVALVMDYPCESTIHDTLNALDKAKKLAKKKKSVLYFARFMRTGAKDLENLYTEARNAGVTFIKYDSIEIDYSEDQDVFIISADDSYGNISVYTKPVVIARQNSDEKGFNRITKLLRLKLDENGFINSDRFFLFPTHTSRKGIYFLNESRIGSKEELASKIGFTISQIKKDMYYISDSSTGLTEAKEYAEVDSGKCAFCYTCYRACTHAAMAPDYENSVMKNLNNSCRACGICVSVCPADAVRIINRNSESMDHSEKSLKVYCCENSGEIAVKSIMKTFKDMFDKVELESVCCGGELSVEIITSELKDFEKVLVVTCMDEACRHFDGNKRARRFVERAREMLKASGLDESKVEYVQVSHAMAGVAGEYIKDMILGK